jgi:hypothetical protein
MKRRETAGAINRAKNCYAWVPYGSEGMWLSVSKPQARQIVADAKEERVEEIEAKVEKGDLFLGCDGLVDIEAPASEAAESDEADEEDEAEEEETELDDETN